MQVNNAERKQMEEGFMQRKCTGFKDFGSNPINSLGFGSVKCSKSIKYIEMEMLLRVVVDEFVRGPWRLSWMSW